MEKKKGGCGHALPVFMMIGSIANVTTELVRIDLILPPLCHAEKSLLLDVH